jgi:hypothetical protein
MGLYGLAPGPRKFSMVLLLQSFSATECCRLMMIMSLLLYAVLPRNNNIDPRLRSSDGPGRLPL